MGPCADKRVRCEIITKDGRSAIGFNDCLNPQTTCPRQPGDDYTKCVTVCAQPGHAEITAVLKARARGLDLTGARAFLSGIEFICQHCRRETKAAGISRIYIGAPR
jgi:deoxycytidylate deaminase